MPNRKTFRGLVRSFLLKIMMQAIALFIRYPTMETISSTVMKHISVYGVFDSPILNHHMFQLSPFISHYLYHVVTY